MAAEGEKKRVLEMVQADGADEGSVTFVMHDEDHTLGNSLRYMIMKNECVEFCGYTITHPSESKINFRIQTKDGTPAIETLRRGLTELCDVCQHVLNTFELLSTPLRHFATTHPWTNISDYQAKVNEFQEKQEQPME
ncbi:DNA-directed RNA polymerases I and III subunit RPAC2 isoform X2 [Nerophis ophidion]|uniref:DNA-directed RNA polymerases I and III subunit RPAC2 isoform X2 n=1 Tax=Nerophis ophidion TaxID=159077 RepID=UPI002ADFA519|nr:DNA-directed RNA polymerases I and III subunit RPAC2 isoform X2 [Nerophis ophidion]